MRMTKAVVEGLHRILQSLEHLGKLDDTVVILTSDQRPGLSQEQSAIQHKPTVYRLLGLTADDRPSP